MSDDLLDCLLSAAEDDKTVTKMLKEDPEFFSAITQPKPDRKPKPVTKQASVVHNGDTDSSDDEHNKYFEKEGYNEFGRAVKSMLPTTPESPVTPVQSSTWKTRATTTNTAAKPTPASNIFTDPLFGIRVVNPLVSHNMLTTRMQGRDAVPMSKIQKYVEMLTPQKDWVIAGVLVHKTNKTSQKGNTFSIWTLSDLHGDLKTISLFLFGSAYKELWKCIIGTVVGVLNPSVFEKKQGSKDEACLSVDNVQRVMIFGQSKDLGTCKSTKKNGEKCTAFVNIHRCEYCIYHIKQEYQKCSKRSELQANFAGRGLTALRNKVLGKNEVFYAGKSFTAIPASKSKKLVARDTGRLNLLSGNVVPNNIPKAKPVTNKKKQAVQLEQSASQRVKDLELLKKLGGGADIDKKTDFSGTLSSVVTLGESKSNVLNVLTKLTQKGDSDNVISAKENIVHSDTHKHNLSSAEIDFLNEDNLSDLDYNLSDLEDDNVQSSNKVININSNVETLINLSDSGKIIENSKIRKDGKSLIQNVGAKKVVDINKKDSVATGQNHNKSGVDATNVVDKNKKRSLVVDNNKNSEANIKINAKQMMQNGNKSGVGAKSVVDNNVKDIGGKEIVKNNKEISKTPKNNTQSKTFKSPPVTINCGFDIPLLSGCLNNKSIDLSAPITNKHVDRAKMNALKWVQRNGPIKKLDPNKCKPEKGKKRALEEKIESDPKKKKIQESEHFSDRFKKMMAMTSKHTNLLDEHDNEEQDKYFNKLEMKERMEEKMIGTYKIECKAVRCIKCKYTSFSAAEKCKTERHPLKVFDAVKRFFKCGDCGNRTVSLDIIPTLSCKNCGSGKWERTSMMKERQVTSTHSLSIRGGEQKHTNSVATNSNINLLVPDD